MPLGLPGGSICPFESSLGVTWRTVYHRFRYSTTLTPPMGSDPNAANLSKNCSLFYRHAMKFKRSRIKHYKMRVMFGFLPILNTYRRVSLLLWLFGSFLITYRLKLAAFWSDRFCHSFQVVSFVYGSAGHLTPPERLTLPDAESASAYECSQPLR